MNLINQLYISAVKHHPEGIKQGRGDSSGKFASKSLQARSWRGVLKKGFKLIDVVDCPCGLVTLNLINQLYISAVKHHPGRMEQGRGESSRKFASKSLQARCWRGELKEGFKLIDVVDCPCGQRKFPSTAALIRHIERSHNEEKDTITFSKHTTLDRPTSLHRSVGAELKRKYGVGKMSEEICPKCRKKFQCLTKGVYENRGAIMVYSDDMSVCDDCEKYEVEQG